MDNVACIDELSQKEETLLEKIYSLSKPLGNVIIGAEVFFAVKYLFKSSKRIFESADFYEVVKVDKNVTKDIHDKLEEIVFKNERIQESLIEIIKKYPQPLLKSSLKELKEFNDYILGVLEEVKIALNPNFFDAMEKIVEGIEKSNFDISKVEKVEPFL